MSIVLIVLGLVMLTVFPALTALRTSSQRSLTQSNLNALMQATAAYVQANGCVPCPTPASTTGNGFGRIRGDASASPASCSGCPTPEGIPPFMSLGVPASTAHDGWGHWMTMRVDPALTANFGVVPPTKPAACACSAPSSNSCTATPSGCGCSAPVNNVCTPLPAGLSQQGLCAPSGSGAGLLPKANSITVQTPNGGTQFAAVIFVSHGSRGFGSFIASATFPLSGPAPGSRLLPFPPAYAPCSANGGYAECNADGNAQFFDAPVVVTGGDLYDDVLAFADRNALVSMFGNGSCQTVW